MEITLNFTQVDQSYNYYELVTNNKEQSYIEYNSNKYLDNEKICFIKIDPTSLYIDDETKNYYQIVNGNIKCVIPFTKIALIRK